MNAPVTESKRLALEAAAAADTRRKALDAVALDDRYTLDTGRAFMSGIHALVRLPMLQRARDAQAGLRTAGFVSGYRGSPLGTYDQALWEAKKFLDAHDVVFQPGVNEELAVDAVWGSQQLEFDRASKKFDGVFGIWYAKGPGVDRSADALKHANLSGTALRGGVVAVAGDDHLSKSSTLAHQSDHTFMACGIPVFAPASVQDVLDLGQHAFALSRYAGVWAGMKTVQEVIECATSVDLDPQRVRIFLPDDFSFPASGVHIRWPDDPLAQEARMMEVKWPAAVAYARANRLNHDVIAGPRDRIGIIASGKAFSDVRQALHDLGLDDSRCRALGVRLHKVNLVWPLEPRSVREFADGLEDVLVVEEKRPIIEQQLKDELYHCPPDRRPRVYGKYGVPEQGGAGGEWSHPRPQDDWLLRATADLTPAIVAKVIAGLLERRGVPADVQALLEARLSVIDAKERALATSAVQGADRLPWFCPGCPHNTSTKVPEGSKAMAGIGCHGMAVWMDRSTTSWTQMGGEGTPWIGQAPFSTRKHMFANLGDGTYNHSGLLAIRQSIAAKVNITYKILFNSAVAMTGGQPIDGGGLGVAAMTRELEAEGIKRIVIVADEPARYTGVTGLAPGVEVRHRDHLDEVQRELREMEGATAIIYDQMCATKKRRERKRGTRADVDTRVIINELVCEGCGDCSTQSNCVAVQPAETEFGRKRRINQSTCNKDFSCVKGFCPSFVTVRGGRLKKPDAVPSVDAAGLPPLPLPALPAIASAWGIVVAGVGGTGVVTIGQVLGMAAHLEGKQVLTQDATGMAQMGGATWSHVQVAERDDGIRASRVAMANADLLIACDGIVAANKTTLATLAPARTFVALNTSSTPTSAFVGNPDWQSPAAQCSEALAAVVGDANLGRLDAEALATRILGASVYTNMLMLGYAWQAGRLPLGHAAIMRAIELNGVQVEQNKSAFEWGRRCRHDLASVEALFQARQVIRISKRKTLDELLEERVRFLTEYQDGAYAAVYRAFVEKVRAAEAGVARGTRLAEAVARNLFKLMSYKDEYEVARLHTGTAFAEQVSRTFEGDYTLEHHMAPPLLARRNRNGELVKQSFGPWMRTAMSLLARMKGVRGTMLDPFGYTHERRTERALIQEYRGSMDEVLASLSAGKIQLAVDIANIPQDIRGFGHVKERHLEAARPKWQALMSQWRA
jgi:indolepyruvate ferredoxin oxidoreductase